MMMKTSIIAFIVTAVSLYSGFVAKATGVETLLRGAPSETNGDVQVWHKCHLLALVGIVRSDMLAL